MYKKTVLDNGLRIVSHAMSGRQSVAVGVWITIGGRYESGKQKGISHFLEHMLFKGSSRFSCRGIKQSIEGVGGSLNGFTSEEVTCYLAKMPAAYSSVALEVLSDMVINPLISGVEVAKEKTVIVEEIKMYKDLPQSHVHELLDELLWPGQPLGKPIIGTEESVMGMDREDLKGFQAAHYTPANIVVSATGAVKHDDLVKSAGRIYGRLKSSLRNTCVPVVESQREPQLKVLDKKTEQTHLAMGFHSFQRDHHLRHALGLMHIILGANMSSRLFEELREKRGLAYEIGTQTKRFRETGAFFVHAGIDNKKVSAALELILKEFVKIKRVLVGPDEFRRAQEFYQGQLMLALEDTMDHMLWIGESTATLDRIYDMRAIIKEVGAVRREEVREAARMVLKNETLNLALIGPLEAQQDTLRRKLVLS